MATSLIDKFMEKYCSDGRAYVGSLSAQSDLLVVKLGVQFWETKLCIFPCCWLWSLIECNIEIGVGLCGCGFAYFFVWKSASEPQNHATKKNNVGWKRSWASSLLVMGIWSILDWVRPVSSWSLVDTTSHGFAWVL